MARRSPLRAAVSTTLAAACLLAASGRARADDLDRDPYDDWRPRFMPSPIALGASLHRISTSRTALSGSSDSTSYSFPAGVLGESVTAWSADFRTTLVDYGPLYSSLEIEAGKAYTQQPVTLPDTSSSFDYWLVGISVGAALPRVGPLTVRVEALTGVRVLAVDMTTPSDCTDADGNPATCTASATQFVFGPRVFVDYALASWASASAWAGGSVVRPGDLSTGLELSLHLPRELY